jgi:hypothetical protein
MDDSHGEVTDGELTDGNVAFWADDPDDANDKMDVESLIG